MMTPELRTALVGLPGRCTDCLMVPELQGGHAPDCSLGGPVTATDGMHGVRPPPPAGTPGLICDNYRDATGTICGATERVAIYLPGPRCPACTPAATGMNPRRTT